MPELSIIMPVYNTARFLDRSIKSVLAQSFDDFELILVNDGSTDDSLTICKRFERQDKRIIVIDKENGGAGSARNAGLQAAHGAFIAFPDSDDWIESDAYEFCVRTMKQYQLDLLLFGSINTKYDDTGMITEEKIGNTKEVRYSTRDECRENWAELIRSLPMDGPSNKIYRHSIIRENGIRFPDLRRMQDGVFNMMYFDKIGSFASIKNGFYHFTQHPSEFQRKKMPASFLDCAITYHKTGIAMLEKWGKRSQEHQRVLDEWFSDTIMVAEFDYLPKEKPSLYELYCHIKSINKNEYVNSFLRQLSELRKLSKKEYAMLHNWNYVLTVYTYLKMRKASAK